MKQITLNLPAEWVETLDQKKTETGLDRSNQIRQAIANEVEDI